MKKFKRLLLRLPYFYYWSWKQYPYNFELWLSLYISPKLSISVLDNFQLIVPKSYAELVKKFPMCNPFLPYKTEVPREVKMFKWYESPKEDKK